MIDCFVVWGTNPGNRYSGSNDGRGLDKSMAGGGLAKIEWMLFNVVVTQQHQSYE